MAERNPREIAQALLSAPGWARIGITAPNGWLREQAALELALAVLEAPEGTEQATNQLPLSL